MTSYFKIAFPLTVILMLTVALPVSAAEEAVAVEKPAADADISEHQKAGPVDTKGEKEKPKTKLKIGKTDTVITVGDLHCKTCAKKISGKLFKVKGVVKVRSDIAADVVIITPQTKKKLSSKDLWKAAQKAGFQPMLLEGPGGKYEPDPKTKEPKLVPKKEQTAKEEVAKKQA